MTAMKLMALTRPLTVGEYAALGEDEYCRTELQEGSLLLSPSPAPDHQQAVLDLAIALMPQVPNYLAVIPSVDIDLELAPWDQPGSSRRPDLVVVCRGVPERVDNDGGMIRASEVVLVVEVVSKGSRRMDHVTKRVDYADAGIEHYWIIDIDEPISLVACHLTAEFGYVDDGAVTKTYTTKLPFEATVDLDGLVQT